MILREPSRDDKAALREFSCLPFLDDSIEQQWIRRKALGWSGTNKDHMLRLLDVEGSILGLYAFEPGAALTATGELIGSAESEVSYWFVRLVAVSIHHQRMRVGRMLFESCLDHIAEIEPTGGAYWHVREGNAASHVISDGVGAEEELVNDAGMTTYFIRF